MSAIAGPGRRGPYRTDDLHVQGYYSPHAPTIRPVDAAVVATARARYFQLAPDSEQRRQIEYLIQRLVAGPDVDLPAMAARLADIIRVRAAGSAI